MQTVESSCCGMAGAFGYEAETIDVSLKMAELSLLPAVRKAPADALIVADGTSCRHQIHDGADREALHVARVLAMSVDAATIIGGRHRGRARCRLAGHDPVARRRHLSISFLPAGTSSEEFVVEMSLLAATKAALSTSFTLMPEPSSCRAARRPSRRQA